MDDLRATLLDLVPRDWTPRQALVVEEFHQEILAMLWRVHGAALCAAHCVAAAEEPRQLSLPLESLEDDLPF